MVSEAGWTLVRMPSNTLTVPLEEPIPSRIATTRHADPPIELLAELRSREESRVRAALGRTSILERMHVAQVIDLLAWDDISPAARTALEQLAPLHLGMLIDAMLDPATDFAIRRRLPRILGTVATRRSLDGLLNGLSSSRFEVRLRCSRPTGRILATHRDLAC